MEGSFLNSFKQVKFSCESQTLTMCRKTHKYQIELQEPHSLKTYSERTHCLLCARMDTKHHSQYDGVHYITRQIKATKNNKIVLIPVCFICHKILLQLYMLCNEANWILSQYIVRSNRICDKDVYDGNVVYDLVSQFIDTERDVPHLHALSKYYVILLIIKVRDVSRIIGQQFLDKCRQN